MNKYSDFCHGIVEGSRKISLEKDTGIKISIVHDGTFVLRASIKTKDGKTKRIIENYKDSYSICEVIKNILDNDIDNTERLILISRKEIRGIEREKKLEKINDRIREIKNRYQIDKQAD